MYLDGDNDGYDDDSGGDCACDDDDNDDCNEYGDRQN